MANNSSKKSVNLKSVTAEVRANRNTPTQVTKSLTTYQTEDTKCLNKLLRGISQSDLALLVPTIATEMHVGMQKMVASKDADGKYRRDADGKIVKVGKTDKEGNAVLIKYNLGIVERWLVNNQERVHELLKELREHDKQRRLDKKAAKKAEKEAAKAAPAPAPVAETAPKGEEVTLTPEMVEKLKKSLAGGAA